MISFPYLISSKLECNFDNVNRGGVFVLSKSKKVTTKGLQICFCLKLLFHLNQKLQLIAPFH